MLLDEFRAWAGRRGMVAGSGRLALPDPDRRCFASGKLTVMPPLNKFKRFDVREMIRGGIEPFPFIRERVDQLKNSKGLIIIAPFLPSPLIEKLSSEGFATKLERGTDADWMVYIWREE